MQIIINEMKEQRFFINNVSLTYLLFKRIFDLVFSLIGILLLSSVFVITYCWIKKRLRGPVLAVEERDGLRGKRFYTCEFARIIKNTTLRKLPQLFIVLIGNMSFVGPLPISVDYVTGDTWFNLRLSAKPGIIGLWQVSGKKGGDSEMVRMDLKYVRERCIRNDLKIILKAIWLMFGEKRASNCETGLGDGLI